MQLGMWDPMGIMADGSTERIEIFRECEVKHGRVAMLAVVGYIVTYLGVRFPGAESVPSGFGAVNALLQTPEYHNVLYQMMLFFIVGEIWNHDKTGKAEFPGDFRNDIHDFGWAKQSDAWKQSMRAKELNNGRAAQMGILALMTHDAMGNVDAILPWAN